MQDLFKYYTVVCTYENWEGTIINDAKFYFGSIDAARNFVDRNKEVIKSFDMCSTSFIPCELSSKDQLYIVTTFEDYSSGKSEYYDIINAPDHIVNRKVIVMNTDNDRRRKLSNHEIEEIKHYYDKHIFTIKELSKMYNVSWPTIKYHVDDTYKIRTNKSRKNWVNRSIENRKSDRYSELANYKRDLIKNNSEVIFR